MSESQLSIYHEFVASKELELAEIRKEISKRPRLSRYIGRRALASQLKETAASLEFSAAKVDLDVHMAVERSSGSRQIYNQFVEKIERWQQRGQFMLVQWTIQIPMFNEDGSVHYPVEVLEEATQKALAEQDT